MRDFHRILRFPRGHGLIFDVMGICRLFVSLLFLAKGGVNGWLLVLVLRCAAGKGRKGEENIVPRNCMCMNRGRR